MKTRSALCLLEDTLAPVEMMAQLSIQFWARDTGLSPSIFWSAVLDELSGPPAGRVSVCAGVVLLPAAPV